MIYFCFSHDIVNKNNVLRVEFERKIVVNLQKNKTVLYHSICLKII